MYSFFDVYYSTVFDSIKSFRDEAIQQFGSKTADIFGLNPEALNEPHCFPCCSRAIHSVTRKTLYKFKMEQSGGLISYRVDNDIISWRAHYFFTSTLHPDIIADPTIGQVAIIMKTSLDEWVRNYPEIFYKKILITDKNTAANVLGVIYPRVNQTFEDAYNADPILITA